ncbi:MAG: hypothetical protein V4618_13455 [Pseudomonadota bacterium]
MSDERPKPEQDEKGRFVPGNAGGGRPKGSRHKLGEAFLEDMLDDWQAHGKAVIEAVRADKPDQYLKVVASILPKELNVKVSELDELTDDQLARQLAHIGSVLAAAGFDLGAGDRAAVTPQSLN